MREVLERLDQLTAEGGQVVLCTVVNTRGSTPQKPGAAMLVLPAGGQVGTLGGGCVEAEVRRESLRLLADGSCRFALLPFLLDNDYGWDDGLICGGRMHVLAEVVDRESFEAYFSELLRVVRAGQGFTEAVFMEDRDGAAAGSRLLFDAGGSLLASLRFHGDAGVVRSGLRPLSDRPRPYEWSGVAYTPHLPRCRLVIAGAGHVGKAVARYASETDFDVWVIDDRSEYVTRDRFPTAERLIVGDIAEQLKSVPCDEHTCVLIVTRGHNHDEEALHAVVTRPFGFIGMIGSRRKVKLILDDLRALGIPQEYLERVRAPIGINIGSRTVNEIAISIVAELVAFRNRAALPANAYLHGKEDPQLACKIQAPGVCE